MELGEKLRQARLEAGLSQRQLCGEDITRNMLSLIENGSARPSMNTLKILAVRLGKPVSFFLEEDALASPNREAMERLHESWDAGDLTGAAAALEAYQGPDPVFQREFLLLEVLVTLSLAEQAIQQGKEPYARALLERLEDVPGYDALLARKTALLRCRLGDAGEEILPSLDEELLIRARAARKAGNSVRCAALLDAAEDKSGGEWNFLRGWAYLAEKAYAQARQCLHAAESAFPEETAPLLEQCYRELEDYKQAYFYACKQKQSGM